VTVEHVQTITTVQLRDMMLAPSAPLLINVIGGGQTVSLPGAIWLRGAGLGDDLNDPVQARLDACLAALTHGDKAQPVVFFCLSKTCWLSYNAAVGAAALGYSHVFWYRGGGTPGTPPGCPWSRLASAASDPSQARVRPSRPGGITEQAE
jgi:PQQ-dependent catabolism-associated CXXCW motif protein